MSDSNKSVEVTLPGNAATREGLLGLFDRMESADEGREANLLPEDVQEAYREIYDSIGDVESVELHVEFSE